MRFGRKKYKILSDFPRYTHKKKVVLATIGLHNFIKISNFLDVDFASKMSETQMRNKEAVEEAHGEHMSQIRDNIENML